MRERVGTSMIHLCYIIGVSGYDKGRIELIRKSSFSILIVSLFTNILLISSS
jgi:hypothetical protein